MASSSVSPPIPFCKPLAITRNPPSREAVGSQARYGVIHSWVLAWALGLNDEDLKGVKLPFTVPCVEAGRRGGERRTVSALSSLE
ncbi:hypothetical protein FOXG_20541 [Fusarium oxysporum f. sp. lycopersici 4287]|uniref:Uncharacterized protein n=2 Tax=Fusarium oxysporum TaxID=5507 RepID=A0A0J9VKA3_FUSO4|nr:hypothetical protein FOXG_20541 [Fusarium oxysporum f. sp. lycopersici 4287]EXK30169.1 hypothetical protein FOMG_13800 [Fusarium oxysporum f. sp. melonis 26406]KNB11644.1 hypothetical protein FOXG_20541 [Fusarium oxysporum f. sp. lycopersici 4287]